MRIADGGGEELLTWREIWHRVYPMQGIHPQDDPPSGCWDAATMNRLRGIAIVQASETEAVLGQILGVLDRSLVGRTLTAGSLFNVVFERLDHVSRDRWSQELDAIKAAIRRRNRLVHDIVGVGYSWRDYQTGGGEHIPVISYLGIEGCDAADLRRDLGLQRDATRYAVEILHYLRHSIGGSNDARYCQVCIEEQDLT